VSDEKGGHKLYQAVGKLKGKKAVITGGDSGIGQATAVLFAMEGAEVFITYLDQEKSDADKTVKLVEKYGGKCHTLAVNLKDKNNCKKTIDEAINKMGAINILFNNHAYQMMINDIHDLSEDQWVHTFDTNIHRKSLFMRGATRALTKSHSFLLPFKICFRAYEVW
jgi:NAD(P)-dependent dehydrogenase (short-subunit alcohol dehydrogenase family)